MDIAYLGPKGTFTEQACETYLSRQNKSFHAEAIPSIVTLFEMLASGKVGEIVVPIENSVEGSVNTTMDLLAKTAGIQIRAEIELAIAQSILAVDDMPLGDIEHIVSHPQALAQCRDFLNTNCPNAENHPAPSTANAAKWVASGELEKQYGTGRIAAIGNIKLSDIYNLKTLKEGINDSVNNVTRFIVIGKEAVAASKDDKTSMIFSTIKDRPGGLVDVLSEFSKRDINLSKIMSRPTQNVLGEYLFFIDCDGHENDTAMAEAIDTVKDRASYFKLLGSYPKENANAGS